MEKKRKQKKNNNVQRVDSSFNWRALQAGDEIWLKAGEGPYIEYTNDDGQLVRESMGHYGRYTVDSVDTIGVHLYDEYGHCFAYFGPRKQMASGTVMESHKITKVRKQDNDQRSN